jgi:hypothetical protein
MKSKMKIRWLLPVVIVVGLPVVLLLCGQWGLPAAAKAQPQPAENGQILVIPIQLERGNYGLAMVDTAGQTLWVYQLNSTGPGYNLLQQYNVADPKPQQVKMLLEGFANRLEKPESQNQRDLNQPVFQTPESNSSESDENRQDKDF